MIIRRCVPETKQGEIIDKCHASPYEDILQETKQPIKFSNPVFFLPTLFKDYFEWVKHCDQCQRMGNIIRRNEMALQCRFFMFGE